jgi:hypothetical protein
LSISQLPDDAWYTMRSALPSPSKSPGTAVYPVPPQAMLSVVAKPLDDSRPYQRPVVVL